MDSYQKMVSDIKGALLQLSDRQFDPTAKDIMKKWPEEVKPTDILELLDFCVHGSLCSGFEITVLQILYEGVCKEYSITHKDVVKTATWREKFK